VNSGSSAGGAGHGGCSAAIQGHGVRAAVAAAALLTLLAIVPAGALLSMMPITEDFQIGETVTLSGMNTENGTTFLFLTGPGLDENGVMLTDTSAMARNGSFNSVTVTDYAWKFEWDTSLSTVNLQEGMYSIYAMTDPLPRGSLPGRRYVTGAIVFRGRLFPATTATTPAPTPVPTWTPAPAGVEVRVSTGPSDDYPGRSEGDYIVYEAKRGEGDSDIYLYNISDGKTTAVATGPALQTSPSFSGGKIVYSSSEVVNFKRSDADLFIYDIATGNTTRLTLPGDQLYPRISGSIIAWQDEAPGRSSVSVMLHDLETNVTLRVPSRTWAYHPDISGNGVTWLDDLTAPAVYFYDIGEESWRRVLEKRGIKGTPALGGTRITWAETVDDWDEILVLDLETGKVTPVTTDFSNHFTPAISGDKVVWVDFRNGNRDIYLYDLSSGREHEVTTSFGQQLAPQIWGCTVAWADDRDGGSFDIYYERLAGCTPSPVPEPVHLRPEETPAPVTGTTVAAATATTRSTPAVTTPVTTPTTKSPGFGAPAALAGLAALAALILKGRER